MSYATVQCPYCGERQVQNIEPCYPEKRTICCGRCKQLFKVGFEWTVVCENGLKSPVHMGNKAVSG